MAMVRPLLEDMSMGATRPTAEFENTLPSVMLTMGSAVMDGACDRGYPLLTNRAHGGTFKGNVWGESTYLREDS